MIDAERVEALLYECLFQDEAEHADKMIDHLNVAGIMQAFEFHEPRYRAIEPEVVEMIGQLQESLFQSGGNTFLAMPTDKDDQQWGEHQHCEMLLALALAGGYARYVFSRDLWPELLGGMPFIQFSTTPLTTVNEVTKQ